VVLLCLGTITCPPVTKPPETTPKPDDKAGDTEDMNFGLEYERYLKEVVSVLETDEMFKQKLEQANVTDIKSGEIARHLDLVSHNVRTKLDELKRAEIERLRQLVRIRMKQAQGFEKLDPAGIIGHVDHNNPHSFEIDDLAKLIKKATDDLEDIDKKRKVEFKEYEMTKEHMRREKMKQMDETKRAEEQKKYESMQAKHKDHKKINHPGSKDQLEEVWEEEDGMDKEDFNPKTFFKMHDLDGDNFLSEDELEALFIKELDKIYDPDNEEDDMVERYEEMNRMREHVMNEIDKDGDKLVSMDEFLKSTDGEDFDTEEGWQGLEEDDMFSEDELQKWEEEYERQRADELHAGNVPHGVPNDQAGVHEMNQGRGAPAVPERAEQQYEQQQKQMKEQEEMLKNIQVQQQQLQQQQAQLQQQQQQQGGDQLKFKPQGQVTPPKQPQQPPQPAQNQDAGPPSMPPKNPQNMPPI